MWKLIPVIALTACCAAPAQAAITPSTAWSDEVGPLTAARLIDECVAASSILVKGALAGDGCVRVAADACIRGNGGTSSQADLNICGRFSIEAWRQKYRAVTSGIGNLMADWAKTDEAWRRQTAMRFPEQEKRWQGWVEADCQLRELGSEGGTIHSSSVARCEERHIALRTLDLMVLMDWWRDH